MEQFTKKRNFIGSVDFYTDLKRKIFLARPHGFINPSLLKEDVIAAHAFAKDCNSPWTYITNTEDVLMVNPFNLLYLKEVKKIRHLKRIVVYAPNPFFRTLLRLVSFIVQPDAILTEKKDLDDLLYS